MAGQDDKKRAHAGEEAPARMESDCGALPVETPAAKTDHAAEEARSAGSNRTLEHLGREVERLANPRNSFLKRRAPRFPACIGEARFRSLRVR